MVIFVYFFQDTQKIALKLKTIQICNSWTKTKLSSSLSQKTVKRTYYLNANMIQHHSCKHMSKMRLLTPELKGLQQKINSKN